MSVVSTVLEEDPSHNMTLMFLVDGVAKTKYAFTTDGKITLFERTDKHKNTFEGFVEGLALVEDWLNKIINAHRNILQKSDLNIMTKFSLASQYTRDGRLKSVFKIGKTKLINTVYDPKNRIISFNPRPTVSMYFKDFQNLLLFQKCMCQNMRLLNKAQEHRETDLDDEIEFKVL